MSRFWFVPLVFALSVVSVASATSPPNVTTEYLRLGQEIPHQVALFDGASFICSGALVSHSVVVTSARCVQRFAKQSITLTARYGTRSRNDQLSASLSVTRITTHAHFAPVTNTDGSLTYYNFDVALLQLNGTVQSRYYGVHIDSIPLNLAIYWDRPTSVTGWAASEDHELLKRTDGLLVDAKCSQAFRGSEYFACLRSTNREAICVADVGSPVVQDGQLIGVVSTRDPKCSEDVVAGVAAHSNQSYVLTFSKMLYLGKWVMMNSDDTISFY